MAAVDNTQQALLPLPAWPPLSPGASALLPLSDDAALLSGDWLLDGDDAVSAPRWLVPQAAPPSAAALPAAPPPAAAPWRCLDPSHPDDCASCLPAPPPAESGRYCLTDAAGQLAEKRLRALLSRCAEWNDAGARARLAASLQAEEAASGLCSGALRSHSSAHMRKHAMLRLAHCWRYRSDCWSVRRSGCSERKRAGPPAQATPPAEDAAAPPAGKRLALSDAALGAIVLGDRTLTVTQAAEAQMHRTLAPLITAAARAWTGPHAAAEYGRARGAGMTWMRVRGMEGALEVCTWLRDVMAQRLRGLRAWRATLDAEQLRSPAYLCEAAFGVPESELEAVRHVLTQGRASTVVNAERERGADGTIPAQHAAWLYDYELGYEAVLALVAHAQAFASAQRVQPLRTFLEAAEATLESLAAFTRANVEALQQRVAWTAEMAVTQGLAAGSRAESAKAMPPLVQRLRLTGDDLHGVRLLALATTPPPLGAPLLPFVIAPAAAPPPPASPPA